MLKGQARTDYMREYMRKRRAAMKQAQQAKATKPHGAAQHDTAALEALKAELARERTKREAVEAQLATEKAKKAPAQPKATKTTREADTGPLEARIKELEAELALERTRTRELKKALARRSAKPAEPDDEAKKAKRAEAAAAKLTDELAQQDGPVTVETLTAELVKANDRIKSLTTSNTNLKRKLHAFRGDNKRANLSMPKRVIKEIRTLMHPDRGRNDAERKLRTECSQAFNRLPIIPVDEE